METDTCLLDSSLVARTSSMFSNAADSVIVVKSHPLLTVFDSKPNSKSTLTAVQKIVKEVKAGLTNPYEQYIPVDAKTGSSVIRPAKLPGDKAENIMKSPPWKLLPSSVKRKSIEADSANGSAPPSKRSRTDLHGNSSSVNQHIRFEDGDPNPITEKTEDDKKALPQDVEIPLRFQVPSKKKKKEKRQDIDIIESVQKHLSHLRELERTNDVALGENPGDQQPFNLAEKIKEKMEQRRLKRKMKEDKKKGKQGDAEPVVDLTMDTAENLSVTVNTGNKSRTVNKESDNRTENKGSEEAIVILDDDKEEDKEESKGFKPYDYAEGAKKLLQGNSSKDSDYYDPQFQNRRGKNKGSRSKAYSKRGQKSFSWKQK
ncbi:uncharacterized protein LOC132745985 [Ruditapes philippinarum]|uniref:uncharacterized protein LOC132745985 n=1 Tax=Ruditapes philippinarum TaxID=129788 RepID=UPI00295A6D0C|nr:uncharacterized protein LOC132745985 [Ruditapes philippinarum]